LTGIAINEPVRSTGREAALPDYEGDAIVAKYTAMTTRVRQLNIPERKLVDAFEIHHKSVLVIGGGGGRVPANMLLFGNRVVSVDRSARLHQSAADTYPRDDFPRATWIRGDVLDLAALVTEKFDVVFFPQNGLDLLYPVHNRERALGAMAAAVAPGGLLAFSSHNSEAYRFSRKVQKAERRPFGRIPTCGYTRSAVVGAERHFYGSSDAIIRQTEYITGMKHRATFCDARNRIEERLASRSLFRRLLFPVHLYVFS
jgi:SAM-dependent methyltransferase